MPPKLIGPYRVLETLGSGGVGTVYRAVDRRTGEPSALKLLSTGPAMDPKAARRLAREFETLRELSHRNVVKVYDTGVFQGYPYLAMELIEGLTLRHYLSLSPDALDNDHHLAEAIRNSRTPGPDPDMGDSESYSGASGEDDVEGLPFGWSAFSSESPSEEYEANDFQSGPEAVRALAKEADEPLTESSMSAVEYSLPFDVAPESFTSSSAPLSSSEGDALNRPERVGRLRDVMLQLCEAISYIHGHGLIHRDLKPSNIMVDEDRMVRLMDFGLAKFISDDGAVTADGRMVGTFRYMAPEQILGENLDARTDLYSLGVILYELLSGRPPFDAKTPYELWQKVLETEPTPLLKINARADTQLTRIAHRLIRKDRGERFQTAEEVLEALSE